MVNLQKLIIYIPNNATILKRFEMLKFLKINIIITLLIILIGCSNKVPTEKVNKLLDDYAVNLSPYKAVFVRDIANIRAKGTACGSPVGSLMPNPQLEAAAKAHAKDMAINHMLQHDGSGTQTDPARKAEGIGSNFMDRLKFFGYPLKAHDLVGETVAHTKNRNVKSKDLKAHFKKALDTILNDPNHCKIFMNSRFKDIGIGAYKSKDGYYWAFEYGEVEN